MNRQIRYRAYIKEDYNEELIGKILERNLISIQLKN